MSSLLIVLVISLLTLLGDFCIKLASAHEQGLWSLVFILGLLLYAVPAYGWFFLMRTHSLAAIGVIYSAATLILLAGLGHFAFGETLGARQVAALVMALGAVLLMDAEAG